MEIVRITQTGKDSEDMKKRIVTLMIAAVFTVGVTACGSSPDPAQGSGNAAQSGKDAAEETDGAGETDASAQDGQTEGGAQTGGSNILIAYFSVPEDIDTDGIDADAGASIVVKDGQVMGNLEYMADVIQQTVGGDLFRIETVEEYPLDHDPLVDQAAVEQDEEARPELSVQIENPDQYDTILLGYPNWWGDMPMPLYTFLEEYDFSGKTIIPFTAHGGSGFSDTVSTISELQPSAEVSSEGLSISRNAVADAEDEISSWAAGERLYHAAPHRRDPQPQYASLPRTRGGCGMRQHRRCDLCRVAGSPAGPYGSEGQSPENDPLYAECG